MSLSLEEKQDVVSDVSQKLSEAQVAILADYRGLTVAALSELRREARASGVEVRIVKNTLARRSAMGSSFECLVDYFVGPLLLTLSEDPVAVAKVVDTFAKSNDLFKIKVGAMDGEIIDEHTITRLASLPSRDELIAKLAGTLRAPLDKFAQTLNEVPSKLARSLHAVCEQKEAV
ncbi:MAG: 50S ribosomal protein L10 [Acidiferrobacteraceae bacterium]|nr:50S ribosomal protein L10 [Acidiferrobacteraceae bacterium]|tara:strand:+ start:227 stop:751 length:525 start_codon:yes stop_codon:yes gene_type:complete